VIPVREGGCDRERDDSEVQPMHLDRGALEDDRRGRHEDERAEQALEPHRAERVTHPDPATEGCAKSEGGDRGEGVEAGESHDGSSQGQVGDVAPLSSWVRERLEELWTVSPQAARAEGESHPDHQQGPERPDARGEA
jgi:hypothetical protein